MLENTYQQCLEHEFCLKGLKFKAENPLPVIYKNIRMDCGYRIDLLVEDKVIVELKSVEELLPVHQAQILTYMRLSGITTGLLINFNVNKLKNGIKRFKI